MASKAPVLTFGASGAVHGRAIMLRRACSSGNRAGMALLGSPSASASPGRGSSAPACASNPRSTAASSLATTSEGASRKTDRTGKTSARVGTSRATCAVQVLIRCLILTAVRAVWRGPASRSRRRSMVASGHSIKITPSTVATSSASALQHAALVLSRGKPSTTNLVWDWLVSIARRSSSTTSSGGTDADETPSAALSADKAPEVVAVVVGAAEPERPSRLMTSSRTERCK
mmetsp:Transcript_4773/g.10401  ORF Transcript_4773/g.10401 Transcript_4773/m.10401 type:complete len:231 (+) Transcript_4773:593-1285(+)